MHSAIAAAINSQVPAANATYESRENGDHVVFVDAASILEVAKALKNNSQYPFKALQVITGCDYEDRIEVTYVLGTYELKNNHTLLLKVKLPRENPTLDSLCEVWKSANWQERECYDMVGVSFSNHPDHRRILCPDDWEGFPLRRDYKASEKYLDMTIYPPDKLNLEEREFVAKQKENESLARPELNWDINKL